MQPQVDWSKLRQEYETSDVLLKDLAAKHGLKEGTIRSRKNREGWSRDATQRNHATQCEIGSVATPNSFPGQCEATGHKSGERCRHKALPGTSLCFQHTDGRPGQCTAKSKQSGERCKKKAEPGKGKCRIHGGKSTGPPAGTQNRLIHGFFSKIFPDDEETMALVQEIMEKSPLDMLWDQIVMQNLAIARSQKIMFVKNRDDLTEYLKREKETSGLHSDGWEKEYELQFAWDKQANFLKAQSTAMKTLEGLIIRYEDLVEKYELKGLVVEEHRLRVEKLKSDMTIARERLDIEREKANLGGQDVDLEVVIDYGDAHEN